MSARPRSPTPSEIAAILYANDVDFEDFLDYHFAGSPELEAEDEIDSTSTELTTDAQDVEPVLDHIIYMYFHADAQIWLPYPAAGATRAEDLRAVSTGGGEAGVAGGESWLDRLVNLGIRSLVRVKRRRIEARGRRERALRRRLTKRRSGGG